MSEYVDWSEPLVLAQASLRDAEKHLLHGFPDAAKASLQLTKTSIDAVLAFLERKSERA